MISKFKNGIERLLLRKDMGVKYPPVFLSGCPRSGTTISFQYLVNAYQWSYFSNHEKSNPKSVMVSAWKNRGCDHYTANSDSAYGKIAGMNSPSDGWGIFHRWFPYYYGDAPVKDLTGLQRTIGWIERLYDLPFIVKNNASSLRIEELHAAFPDAFFLHVNRNIYDNVASLVKGLEKNSIPIDKMWGTGPHKLLQGHTFIDNVEKSVFQYFFIQYYVDGLRAEGLNIAQVNYEDVVASQGEVLLATLKENYHYPLRPRKDGFGEIVIRDTGKTVAAELQSAIDACRERMDSFALEVLQRSKRTSV